jgi:hypothetical protein
MADINRSPVPIPGPDNEIITIEVCKAGVFPPLNNFLQKAPTEREDKARLLKEQLKLLEWAKINYDHLKHLETRTLTFNR